jgi:hypothetical protein
MIATSETTTLVASSAVLATGAPIPAVVALMTGRAADFSRCTPSAISTPTTTGTHWLDEKKAAGSLTVTVSEDEPAPKARPPAVGRTTVWTTSLMWSTTGTLSATTSTASRTARIAMTQPLPSHCQLPGRSIRFV